MYEKLARLKGGIKSSYLTRSIHYQNFLDRLNQTTKQANNLLSLSLSSPLLEREKTDRQTDIILAKKLESISGGEQ